MTQKLQVYIVFYFVFLFFFHPIHFFFFFFLGSIDFVHVRGHKIHSVTFSNEIEKANWIKELEGLVSKRPTPLVVKNVLRKELSAEQNLLELITGFDDALNNELDKVIKLNSKTTKKQTNINDTS